MAGRTPKRQMPAWLPSCDGRWDHPEIPGSWRESVARLRASYPGAAGGRTPTEVAPVDIIVGRRVVRGGRAFQHQVRRDTALRPLLPMRAAGERQGARSGAATAQCARAAGDGVCGGLPGPNLHPPAFAAGMEQGSLAARRSEPGRTQTCAPPAHRRSVATMKQSAAYRKHALGHSRVRATAPS
jgi:hypothetical protein